MKEEERSTRSGFTRRQVLGGTSALAAGLLARPASAVPRFFFRRGGSERDVLVLLFLRGGMDGLTTVVPHGDGDYYAARPNLAVPPPGQTDGALDLDGFFGLAPAAAPLLTPYGDGRLLFVHACGSTDPTRSHFDAFARMELGYPNLQPGALTNGWLARTLIQTAPGATSLLRGVGAGHILPLSLAGAPSALPFFDLGEVFFPGQASTAPERAGRLAQLYGDDPAPVGPAALDSIASVALLSQVDFAGYTPENGALYPATALGEQFRNTAALIKAEKGVEAITLDYKDWDHHASQGPLDGSMAAMLDELSRSLEAFYLDMQSRIGEVCVVCMTEFGRRLAENSSLGTDHGHGSLMLLLGGGIDGGRILANWPGLAPGQLDNGDLAITIDYRDILGEILLQRLGATDLGGIFPLHGFTTYGVTV